MRKLKKAAVLSVLLLLAFVRRPDCDGMGTVGREPKRCGV